MDNGSWKLEGGSRESRVGSWESEDGSRKMGVESGEQNELQN